MTHPAAHPTVAQAAAAVLSAVLARAAALLLLALVVLAGQATAAESGAAEVVYIPPETVIPSRDGLSAELMVRLPRNTTAVFDCLGNPANTISKISGSAVDVLGSSWLEFQNYPEYETELLPCEGQPSCQLFVHPGFWWWADDPAQCPSCSACPACNRSLRVNYICTLASSLRGPAPLSPPALPTQPAQTSSSQAASSSGTSTPVGAIVGGVVGGVAAVAAVLAVWLYYRRRQHAEQSGASAAADNGECSDNSSHLGMKAHKPHDWELPMSNRPSQLTLEALKALQAQQRSLAHSGHPLLAGYTAAWHSPEVGGSAGGSTTDPLTEGPASPTAAGAANSLATHVSHPSSVGSAVMGTSSAAVDIKPWLLPFSDLDLHSRVGDGSHGTVFMGYWHQTEVAVKVLHGPGHAEPLSLSNPLLAGLQAEATTMASLRHPCCVQFLGVCVAPPAIVSEFCSRGSLTDVLHLARASPSPAAALSWERRLSIAAEAAAGMSYLHSRSPPVVHRDLKSHNILIDRDWHAKIGDYNLAKVMDGTEPDAGTTLAATNPAWLSPEVLHGGRANFASDVYAMGIILWELMTLELPWAGQTNPFTIFKSVTAGQRPPLPADLSTLPGGTFPCLANYVALMQECWAQQPQQRPTFADVTARLREMQAVCRRMHAAEALHSTPAV